jgi:cytochrome c oxidase accessory protein FixG
MAANPQSQQRRLVPNRDALTSVADDGSHIVLHPADTRGRFTLWRRVTAVLLIGLYAALPWIPINGAPALFLDVANLRFHLFGLTLAAQDLWLAFFLITGCGFTLFFVTALFGRLWCGWACPQTVFLEHVYRRIERLIEGDAPARRQLDRAPWTTPKVARRALKHALFILVSLLITHVLLAYFVSIPHVFEMVTHSPAEHWGIFLFILVSTGILYINFAWFREQLCIILCPYGRLQSALIDDNSVVIGYDARRGEPRGKRHGHHVGTIAGLPAEASAKAGDCIDCLRCVQVCPTGIDIRQGLQLECVACSNCIDACDDVMDRVGRPRGLIRYDSLNGLSGGRTRFLRPRIVLYSALLVVGGVVATIATSRYGTASMMATRMTGSPYFVDAEVVRNQFLVRVVNKQTVPVSFTLALEGGVGASAALNALGWETPLTVAAGGEEVRPLIVLVPRAAYEGKFKFNLKVASADGAVTLRREVQFVGPDPRLFKAHAQSLR